MEPSFIINVGSYEKALYGYDAMFNPNYAAQQKLKSKGQLKDEAEEFKFLLRPIYAYMPHTGCIKVLASNEKYLASASTDEMIKVYDLTKRVEVGTLSQHEGMVTAMQFWKNKYLFTASMDGTVCVWVTKDWDIVQILKHKAPILAMAVHPSGKLCLTAGNDKKMKLWDMQTGNCASTMPLEQDPDLVMWSPAGETFAVVINQQVLIYSAKTGKVINTLKEPKRINAIAYLSEKVLASGGENRQINVWQIYEGTSLHVLTGFENRIKNLFAIDKPEDQKQKTAKYPYLISTSSDCSVKIFDLDESTQESVAETYIDDSRITCLTASYVVDMQVKAKKEGEEDSSDMSEESIEDQPRNKSKKRKRDQYVTVEQEEDDGEQDDDEDDENGSDLDDEDVDSEMEGQVFDAKDVPELLADEISNEEDDEDNGDDNNEDEDEEEEEIEQPKKIAKKVKNFDAKKQNKANNKQNKQKNKKTNKKVVATSTANKNNSQQNNTKKVQVADQPKQNNNNKRPAANKQGTPLKGILKKK